MVEGISCEDRVIVLSALKIRTAAINEKMRIAAPEKGAIGEVLCAEV